MIKWIRDNYLLKTKGKELSNQEIRKFFDSKKFKIRFYATILTTVIIIIGCELSSPHYSITGILSDNVVSTSPTLKAVLSKGFLHNILGYIYSDPNDLTIVLKNSFKSIIIIIALVMIGIHLFTVDPLSNSELLRNLSRNDSKVNPPFLLRFLREIHFYAISLPSNSLPGFCKECTWISCPNRLNEYEDKRTFRWASIFAYLSPSHVINLLEATNRCRLIFYLRYLLIFSGTVLIGCYFAARFVEYIFNIGSSINFQLIIYIVLLFVSAVIIGAFNFSSIENARGVWGNFKEIVNQILDSENFIEVFKDKVCKHKNGHYLYSTNKLNLMSDTSSQVVDGTELENLITLVEFLDRVVENKLLNLLTNTDSSQLPDKALIRNLLSALTQMYSVNNNDDVTFRSVIFIPSECSTYLKPYVAVPPTGQSFITFEDDLTVKTKLSRDSGSVAAKAWITHKVHCSSGDEICFFHDHQKEYLKSIIAYPLIFNEQAIETFEQKGLPIDPFQGILCIDSSAPIVFADHKLPLNEVLIKPFATRILFEITISYIKKMKRI